MPPDKVQRLFALARQHKVMIATAESCTGGLIAAALTDVAGSSAVFECGFVTYSNHAKIEMLGVRAATLAQHGAVSEAVAAEMVAGALVRSQAEVAVATTGVAGPGATETKPEGCVCFAIAQRGGRVITETINFGALGREIVRQVAVSHALSLSIGILEA